MKWVLTGLLLSQLAVAQTARRTGYVTVADNQVFFERRGAGKPVLFLHAGFMDHLMWRSQVTDLSSGFETITIDLPGHGVTRNGDSSVLIAEVIKTVLDSLNLPRVSVVGLSLGSVAAMDFLLAHPERVTKAVFVSPGIMGWESKFAVDPSSQEYFDKFSAALKAKDSAAAAEVFTHYWGDGLERDSAWNKRVRAYIYSTTYRTIVRRKVSGWPGFDNTSTAINRLGSIQKPVLVIYGSKDLPYIHSASEHLVKDINGARKLSIPGTAHMLNMEQPAIFNAMLRTFLQ